MAVSIVTLGYGAIGLVDDWQIVRRRSNKGISPRLKLTLQLAVGSLFCLWLGGVSLQTLPISTCLLPGFTSGHTILARSRVCLSCRK